MTEAEILELTYFDKAAIYGQIEYKKFNGAKAFKSGMKAENVKCAISKKDTSNVNQTDITNNIRYNVLMFCSTDTPITAGDDVEIIFENGIKRKYEAGEFFPYLSHLEVPLLRKDKA
ncbi:hypothetical protein [Clostridium drakei]|uniref:Uncharacterized protein n=1 Tax=Clostridium drakei TaxID=332101 RepID=A0A2U8DNC3_9CLOT|nr:hypothetical protein [Clostridium drakei]AWI04058.1 hypothetical protein B9W14_05960 [Clostridium drakei]